MRYPARFAITFLCAIPLVLVPTAFAQRPGSTGTVGRYVITGVVLDEDQHTPIAGAQIRLSTSAGQMMSTSYATTSGEFSFTNLAGGYYKLATSANGFEPAQQDVSMLNNSTENLKINLRKSTNQQSDSEAPGNTISSRELSLPSKAQDALEKGRDRLYQKHDPAGSLPYFRKVNDLAPNFYEAYYDEGIAYTLEGQPSDADAAFRKSIATSQDHYAEPCFALASLLTDQKHFIEAEKLARKGIAIQPDAWRGHYELARALLGEGRLADAEKSGIEARKLKEDFPGLYLILANIHLQLHNNEAVLEDVNAFLKLDPSGPNSGQAREIRSQMERALGHPPSSQLLPH